MNVEIATGRDGWAAIWKADAAGAPEHMADAIARGTDGRFYAFDVALSGAWHARREVDIDELRPHCMAVPRGLREVIRRRAQVHPALLATR